MARGTYGPALAVTETNCDAGEATVWFTGTRVAPPWPRLAVHQLSRLRRPPRARTLLPRHSCHHGRPERDVPVADPHPVTVR